MSISQSRGIFRDVSKTSQKHLTRVVAIFQKCPTKLILCEFHRVITISDKIDVGPLETLKKWNVFWEQCVDINQVYHEHQWAGIYMRVLASKRSIVGVLFTTFSDSFRPVTLFVTHCHFELYWNTKILAKLRKSWVISLAIDIWSTLLIAMLFFS